jgi:hypothetical protein
MFKKIVLACLLFPSFAFGHEDEGLFYERGDLTCLESEGIPDHETGKFPNSTNPNFLKEQSITFCFPSNPEIASSITHNLMTVGVSSTGIPIRPYTAGYYDPEGRRGVSQDPQSGWRQQAMFSPRSLGMNEENAHVDKSGLYHYHAASPSLLTSQGGVNIGYAPDGFKIVCHPEIGTSSWTLKTGLRPDGPGGAYDGMYEEDFVYVSGLGTLDECNGLFVEDIYFYFATDEYPYFPRCFKGVVNESFMSRH